MASSLLSAGSAAILNPSAVKKLIYIGLVAFFVSR